MKRILLLILAAVNAITIVLSVHDDTFVELSPSEYRIETTPSGESKVYLHTLTYGSGLQLVGLSSGVLATLNLIGRLIVIREFSICRRRSSEGAIC